MRRTYSSSPAVFQLSPSLPLLRQVVAGLASLLLCGWSFSVVASLASCLLASEEACHSWSSCCVKCHPSLPPSLSSQLPPFSSLSVHFIIPPHPTYTTPPPPTHTFHSLYTVLEQLYGVSHQPHYRMEDPQLGYLLNSVSGKCDEQRRTGVPVHQCHSFSFSDYGHVSQSVLRQSPVLWGIVYDSEQ